MPKKTAIITIPRKIQIPIRRLRNKLLLSSSGRSPLFCWFLVVCSELVFVEVAVGVDSVSVVPLPSTDISRVSFASFSKFMLV
jgi:hypothetical protein